MTEAFNVSLAPFYDGLRLLRLVPGLRYAKAIEALVFIHPCSSVAGKAEATIIKK